MDDSVLHIPEMDWLRGLELNVQAKLAAIEYSKRLAPLAGPISWSGTLLQNGLGHGSPTCQMSGESVGTWVNDGLYLLVEGDYRFVSGQTTRSFWKFDFLIGYEPIGKRYCQLLADNVGAVIKDCTLTGTRFIVDFPQGASIERAGHTILYRQVYDWAEEGKVRNTFELKIDAGDWAVTADLEGRYGDG